jgi:hypothetical protein
MECSDKRFLRRRQLLLALLELIARQRGELQILVVLGQGKPAYNPCPQQSRNSPFKPSRAYFVVHHTTCYGDTF